jgi:hypothetical protein
MTKQTFRRLTAAFLFLLTTPVYAQQFSGSGKAADRAFTAAEIAAAKKDPLLFTLDPDSIRIVRKAPIMAVGWEYLTEMRPTTGYKNPIVIIAEIVNIALKVWDIVQSNAPIVDINSRYASAMPRGINSWTQLTGWGRPIGYVYGFTATNLYGMKWVDVEYKVLYTSGGQYEGKGKYLTGVTIIPTKVDVQWGTHVTLTAQVPDSTIVNIGTTDDPVAALQLVMASKIATVMSNLNSTDVYYIDGYGNMQEITRKGSSPAVKDIESAAPLLGDQAETFK